MALINKAASSSKAMHDIGVALHNFAFRHGWSLRAYHIPGKDNTVPDALSRVGKEAEDYQFNRTIFKRLNEIHGPFTIDRFATHKNALVSRFNAEHWDPRADAINAFAQNWAGDNNWANPPSHSCTKWSILSTNKRLG